MASVAMLAVLVTTACSGGNSDAGSPAAPLPSSLSDAGVIDASVAADAGVIDASVAADGAVSLTPAAITAACKASVDAAESWRLRCGAIGFSAYDRPTALAQCERNLNAPGVSGSAVGCLTTQLATASCSLSSLASLELACPSPSGTLADGAACAFRTQCSGTCKFGPEKDAKKPACGTCAPLGGGGVGAACQDGADCSANLACYLGKCSQSKAEGATCSGSFDLCGAGLVCLGGTNQCGKVRKLNETCEDAFECDVDLRCSAGTCKAKAVVGETCTSALDCAQGLGCDRATSQCKAFVFGAQGATCDFGFDFKGANLCAAGACDSSFGSTSGKCPTVLALGASCGGNVVGACAGESKCLDGTCALYDAAVCK